MTKEFKIEWPDNYLFNWEKEIFNGQQDNFEDYLFNKGVISRRGGIKRVGEYRELDRKWRALQYARERREKQGGYVERKKWLAKLCKKNLIEKIDIREETKEKVDVQQIPF